MKNFFEWLFPSKRTDGIYDEPLEVEEMNYLSAVSEHMHRLRAIDARKDVKICPHCDAAVPEPTIVCKKCGKVLPAKE